MAAPTTLSGITMGNAPAGAFPFKVDFIPAPIIVAAGFDTLAVDVRSFREPLKRSVQQVAIPSIGKNFAAGGRPDKWPRLSVSTEMIRERLGYGPGPVLIRSGMLRRAATQLNAWTIDEQKAYVASLDVPQGGKAWYGVAQQVGYVGGYGAETPARPFMMLQEEDMPLIEEVFFIWIEERMAASGFNIGEVIV